MKTVERMRLIILTTILTVTTMAGVSQAETPFGNMSSAGFRIVSSGMSSVGGSVAATDTSLTVTASNMYPYQQDLSSADFGPIYKSAEDALKVGKSFRNSLVLFQYPPLLPSEDGLGKLLKHREENYETVPGLLNNLPSAEANLIKARDIFAYGVFINYPGSVENLTDTLKALAGIYLMIADEFLIDALEFRFSWSAGSTYFAEDRLLEQICKLGLGKSDPQLGCQSIPTTANNGAQYYYEKALDSFIYGFYSAAMGKNVRISDYFKDDIYSLFNLTAERLATTLREKSAKQFAKGMSPNATIEAATRKNVGDSVRNSYISSYIVGAAIASQTKSSFSDNGVDGLVSAIAKLKSIGNTTFDGKNPLGYDDRFIPMQEFSKLLNDADGPIDMATLAETRLRDTRREYDASLDQLKTAINNIYMSDSEGGYKVRLSSMTGVDTADPDFIAKVTAAGEDLYDCDIDSDDATFTRCMSDPQRTKGSLWIKYSQIRDAQNGVTLAQKREQNQNDYIAGEQSKHDSMIIIENKYKDGVRDTLLSYLSAMKNARTVERVISKEHGKKKEKKTVTTYNLDYTKLELEVQKDIDLQNRLVDYRIQQMELFDHIAMMNYVNELAVRTIETGAAIDHKNAIVQDFDNLMEEKKSIVYMYKKAVDDIAKINSSTIEDVKDDVARLRIIQSQDAINLSVQLGSAIHLTYLAAKALEYWYMTPLKRIPIFGGSQYLSISDLYKVQTVDDLKSFIGKLNAYNTCPWGFLQPNQIAISVPRDIWGISDSDPDRINKLKDKLAESSYPDNSIRFNFSLSLNDKFISNSGMYNIKIWVMSPSC